MHVELFKILHLDDNLGESPCPEPVAVTDITHYDCGRIHELAEEFLQRFGLEEVALGHDQPLPGI